MERTKPSTTTGNAKASLVNWLAALPNSSRRALIGALPADDLSWIRNDWRAWAAPSQIPPDGDWNTWLFLGGRGAGKTRAGAEWLSDQALPGRRLALVGPTLHDVREVMIEGPSGLRAIAPPDRRPIYEPTRRRLVWPNGAVASAFSAEDADSLRGPQFHHAWGDEFCAWKRPGDVLAMLRLGLRLGQAPQLALTTTPRPIQALRELMAAPGVTLTRARTADNAAHLSPGFQRDLARLYGGSRLEAQELEGQVLDDLGGLWSLELLARCRCRPRGDMETVYVGLDPPASAKGDACGIVAVGRRGDTAYVLEDATVKGRAPLEWAKVVADVVARRQADWVIAETNQGGEMVLEMLRMARCAARVRPVHAIKGKVVRAEPVAALYEQGRVLHCGAFPELEEELMRIGEVEDGRSPDRADALVWAVSHLMLGRRGAPRLSRL